jgi:hypothetical protein
VNTRAFRRSAVALAAFSATAIVLAGCAGGGGSNEESDGDAQELTIATFNDFGYTDELLAEFTEETGIKVVHNKAATSNDARANFFQKLGKEGLADVEAVEVDWFSKVAGWTGRKPRRPMPTATSSRTAPTSARRASASGPTSSRPPDSPPTARPSPSSSRRGTPSSRSARTTPRPRASRSSTRPTRSSRAS